MAPTAAGGWTAGSSGIALFAATQAVQFVLGGSSTDVYDLNGVGSGPGSWLIAPQQPFPIQRAASGFLNTQTAAIASVAAYTPLALAQRLLFRVSVTLTITTIGTGSVSAVLAFHDDQNNARTLTIPLCPSSGTFATVANAADAWHGSVVIGVWALGGAITLSTTGTFTGGFTYAIDGLIEQIG